MSTPLQIQAPEDSADTFEAPRGGPAIDPRQRALVLGIELGKRAAGLKTLDELNFLIVNDLRALIEFDRCFLITHLGGTSVFAAANNQPTLDNKSKLYGQLSALAPVVKPLAKAVVIPNKPDEITFPPEDVPDDLRDALLSYLRVSDCTYFVCVPLIHQEVAVGHIVLEFYGERVPGQFEILGLVNIAPLLAIALSEKWILSLHPELAALDQPYVTPLKKVLAFFRLHWGAASLVAIILVLLVFFFPQYYTVGGEAEVAPLDRRAAFCKIEGLIDKVLVSEGASVQDNQILARLDPKDQDYAIETVQREVEILSRQAKHLALESDETPAKLAERQVLELERKKRLAELAYKKWQAQFLEIRAPVSGIILTRDIESLAGKRMRPGEPFCEIAVPGELVADIYVPEDKGTLVRPGQQASLYLNNNPGTAYSLTVKEVAPSTEVVPRLGNVLRVRAGFESMPVGIKVGMKGIGKIFTEKTNIWTVVTHGLLVRWNHLSLYF